MYIPAHHREDDLATMQAWMRDYSFANLVSVGDDGVPMATPLPFLYKADPAPYGTLEAHMALGNAQWRTFQQDREVLVIFQGPHAYVTPSWYETKLSVPTWNYIAVHAYGVPRIIEDHAVLYEHLKRMVQFHETQFPQPWPFEQLPGDFVEKMMKGVVGFSLEITRLEGKRKVSQNRTPTEQARVAEELSRSEDSSVSAVGKLMKKNVL
ncbi:MAG TPA: FMN-binding negative transcriptional regulator [Ktedonobacteraceae bacterium]|jgi:transcriptional regulator